MSKRNKNTPCGGCGKLITSGAKTGMCRPCNCRARAADPAFLARRAEAVRRKFAEPAFAAKMRRHAQAMGRANGTDPTKRARLVEIGKVKAANLYSPESLAKRLSAESRQATGNKISERALSWCPQARRDEYRRLTRVKRISASAARTMILAQAKIDRARMSPFERQDADLAKQMARAA